MFGLDEYIAGLNDGQSALLALSVAVLLGLRHATDPDHLTAVSTLVASERERTARRAGALGLSWGLGHATTLFALGLPIVLFNQYLPEFVVTGAEVAIGLLIVALAVRLLVRWRRGYFHVHVHRHDGRDHVHLHAHEHAGHRHDAGEDHDSLHRHSHAALGRSPVQAYGLGLFHGVGGSAGVGILLLGAIRDDLAATVALVLFALCTALSMALVSGAFGYTLSRPPLLRRFAGVAPAFGTLSLAFGAWYILGALGTVPYYF